MKIIFNNIIPFPGYKAMAIWPFIFVRKDCKPKFRIINHETIHLRQQAEMLIVIFFLWYLVEWLVRSIQYRSFHKGYRNICFEREAYAHENELFYPDERKHYSFFKYLKS